MDRVAPDFLIIGAQKCGTNWLFRQLSQHPQVFLARPKDGAHFFWSATRDRPRQKAYSNLFTSVQPHHLAVGEATGTYFWTPTRTPWNAYPEGAEPTVARRIKDDLGNDVKLLLCLRDPVDRAISAYLHYLRSGALKFGTSLMDASRFRGIVEMGFYACHLAHWLQHFDLRQFLILALEEDIAAQPEATVLRVQSFLGLTRHDPPATVKRVVNGGLPRIWRDDVLYVSPPRGSEEPVMTLDTVRRLRDIYRADVQALERLIDRPISKQWLTANSLQ